MGGREARKNTRRAWTHSEFGGRAVWDWLQLLIVPIILSLITVVFTWQQGVRQDALEVQRAKSERKIEEQRAQDAALQAYLDQMSQLMLGKDLRGLEEDSAVRTLARARTRTILTRLDGRRKGSVVQFLYEASLLKKDRPVVSLSDVRLRGADLSQLDLSEVNLSGAGLRSANLSGADLSDADLSGAILIDANLSFATISNTNMSGTYLDRANLRYTSLIDTDLSGANLSGADLREAYLRYADLREAYLIDTDLNEANLSDANLRDARGVTDEQLEEQATTLEGATMPDGSIHD
jgi:uncharacterized protein YjbI with pentapeptide repeats